MKKYALIATTVTCLFALTTGLRADDGVIVAHVDQEFVAAGKTFSAGTYRFAPELESGFVAIRNLDGRDSTTMLLPMFEGAASAGEHSHLTFQRVEGTSYLSQIATRRGVYSLASPKASTKLVKAKERDRMSASGTN